jgi:hypothetical protein
VEIVTTTGTGAAAPHVEAALEEIRRTLGYLPDGFRILAARAPEAFLGYMGLRNFVFRAPPEGHLEIWTKEFIFVLLDIQVGNIAGAKSHVRAAIRAGLTIGQLTEGLIQLIMVGGITTWNLGGREILEHAIAATDEEAKPAAGR